MKLPERLDTAYASSLKADIESAIQNGEPVDASDVAYVGGLCFQILIATGVNVSNASPAYQESMTLFGTEKSK